MSVIAPEKVANIIREASNQFIVPRYNSLKDAEISTKTGPNDLVTQADLDVEEHFQRVLPDLLPGSVFVGEESVSSGAVSLDTLKDHSRPIWIADPVDGTYNFVHGKREFAVMVGLIIDGITHYSWIYDVLADDMIAAERGAGAYIEDVRLKVNDLKLPKDMIGHINPRYFPERYSDHIKRTREEFKHCRSLSCAGHEYLRIVKGEAQFSVYSRHKPWDHVPGGLILEEAGGFLGKWDFSPYDPNQIEGGIIAASSEEVARDIYTRFIP